MSFRILLKHRKNLISRSRFFFKDFQKFFQSVERAFQSVSWTSWNPLRTFQILSETLQSFCGLFQCPFRNLLKSFSELPSSHFRNLLKRYRNLHQFLKNFLETFEKFSVCPQPCSVFRGSHAILFRNLLEIFLEYFSPPFREPSNQSFHELFRDLRKISSLSEVFSCNPRRAFWNCVEIFWNSWKEGRTFQNSSRTFYGSLKTFQRVLLKNVFVLGRDYLILVEFQNIPSYPGDIFQRACV